MKRTFILLFLVLLVVYVKGEPIPIIPKEIVFKDGIYGELENGFKYYVMEDETKLAHIIFYIKAGKVCENDVQSSLSMLTLETILNGEGKVYKKDKVRKFFEDRDVKINYTIDRDFIELEISTLRENLKYSLELLKDLIFNSTLSDESYLKAKDKVINSINPYQRNPLSKVEREIMKLLYSDSTPEGSLEKREKIENIKKANVIDFYKRYFTPSNSFIGILSSYDLKEIEELVKITFSTLEKKKADTCPNPDIKEDQSLILILQKSNLDRTIVAVGKKINISPKANLIEDLPLIELVFTLVYSDSPYSRLIKEFKVERDLSEFLEFKFEVTNSPRRGYFTVKFSPLTEKTGFSCYMVGRVFSDLLTNFPDEKEILYGKIALLGNLVTITVSPEQLLKTNMEFIKRGFPPNYLKHYFKKVVEAKDEEIKEILKEYFSMQKYKYVIFGSAEKISRELEPFGKITIKSFSIED